MPSVTSDTPNNSSSPYFPTWAKEALPSATALMLGLAFAGAATYDTGSNQAIDILLATSTLAFAFWGTASTGARCCGVDSSWQLANVANQGAEKVREVVGQAAERTKEAAKSVAAPFQQFGAFAHAKIGAGVDAVKEKMPCLQSSESESLLPGPGARN